MIVMLKRFSADDVPVHVFPLGTTMSAAVLLARATAATLTGNARFASPAEQEIAGGDIGTECLCLWLVQFDAEGNPAGAEFVGVE